MIHDGTKPVFHCDLCPAKYGRTIDVRMHMQKMHQDLDVPANCNKCGKPFKDLYSLKVKTLSMDFFFLSSRRFKIKNKCWKIKFLAFVHC
jgi:hypothetical protein